MNIGVINNVLSDSNLSEREKTISICNHLKEYCLQQNHILNCFRGLNTLKSELSELVKDADLEGEKILRRVIKAIKTELKIVIYQIEHPELKANNTMGMPKFKRLHWTASKTGIVEIIYLIRDCVNKGDVEAKEIADWFEYIFQIDLENMYKLIEQVADRRKTKTKFLDEQILIFSKFLENFSIREPGRNKK